MSIIESRIKIIINGIAKFLCDPFVDSLNEIIFDSEYLNAVVFKEKFEAKEEVDYEWIWHYAEKQYEELEAVNLGLDEKAEAIVRNLGGGIGILTVAAGAFGSMDDLALYQMLLCATPLLFATMSIAIAIFARAPRYSAVPPSIRDAIQYAEFFGKESRSNFLSQWNLACIGKNISNSRKARLVWYSYLFFGIAVLSLAIPIISLSLAGSK